MKIGFIGLGNLGSAMVRRLRDLGVDLTVWNRTPGKAKGLGVRVAKTPADLADTTDLIFLNLFDSEAVASVLTGGAGLFGGACKGKIVIDTSTNHFQAVEQFHKEVRAHDAAYLEAPVIGSVLPASQGNLTVLVSGERRVYESALPSLNMVGKNIFFLEQIGLATKMKLVNNMVLASFMATLAEAVSLGEDVGAERGKVLEILAAGAGNSTILSAKKEKLLKEDFTPQFSAGAMYKDLRYLQDLAGTIRRPLYTAGIAAELFEKAASHGRAEKDFSVVYKVLRET